MVRAPAFHAGYMSSILITATKTSVGPYMECVSIKNKTVHTFVAMYGCEKLRKIDK